jgi:transcriptional regulator with XRE-family HTH domain
MPEDETPADRVRAAFAKRLEKECADRNWNQSDLGREASKHLPNGEELSRDNISNYFRARALPKPGFLLAIAKAFNMRPEDLLPERGLPPPRGAGVAPLTDVSDVGGGRAFLRVNKAVKWSTAVKILEILREDDEPNAQANQS